MRNAWLRPLLTFALAWTAACADDIPEVVTGSTTGDETSSPATDGPPPPPDTGDTTEGPSDTTEGPADTTDGSSSSGGGATCGDDMAEGDEVCDGSDLAGEDCASQGFSEGRLACAADCTAFDTAGCVQFTCGNDLIEGAEVCDGTDLAGQDCQMQGFDAGTLGCAADCSDFDATGCIMFSCGNDTLEGAEVCDGADLAGQDCVSQGFDGGTLACAGGCAAFDTAGCYECGDGSIGGPEICDGADLGGQDCVSQGLDGGTLACAVDCGGFDTSGCYQCGDGVTAGPEVCDGADLVGESCVSQGFGGGALGCAPDCGSFDTSACNTCGDGVITGAETCDGANLGGQTCVTQGFDYGPLGCDGGCGLSLIHCVDITTETEPNDDGAVATATNDFSAANANGPYTSDALISASIGPAGDDDGFAISNPGSTYQLVRIQTFGPTLDACGGIDTVVSVLTAAGTQVASNDDGGFPNCSLIPTVVLAPGQTLYVRVIDFGDNTAIASYHLYIRFDEVICGDGLSGPGEQCDDGNAVGGDGCSSTCVLEAAVPEVEPNNTSADADAAPIVITGNTILSGTIGAVGDVDRFRMTLAAPQNVRVESFTALGQCNGGLTTTLRILDAAGALIIGDDGSSNGSGIAGCSGMVFPLAAGTYYVQVEETGNNGLIPTYLLEVAFLGDAGVESEANEDIASADVFAGNDVFIFGDHAVQADSDFFAFDVPVDGSSVRLELMEGDRAVETCESNGIDSRLTLYNAAGTQLVDDDDDGRGFCSLIDGTGTNATRRDAGAHTLPAGTYYAQVRASTFAQMSANGQFIYRLVVTVRQP